MAQEPELGTTGPDVLYVPLELKLIKIIIFIFFFLFITKIIHCTVEKTSITSIILPQNTINNHGTLNNMKNVYSGPLVLCEKSQCP